MAAIEMVDIRTTEDTLSQSPGEDGPRDDIPRRVHEADDEVALSLGPANRVRHEQADQEKQQPPSTAAERIEPQRPEQRDDERFQETPRDGPAVVRPDEVPRTDSAIHTLADRRGDGKPQRDRQPREHQPRQRHCLARCSGGTYPGPRNPRPGRAVVILPWSSTF